MTAPLLQYIARFDGGGEIVGFGEGGDEKHGAPCLSDSRLYYLFVAPSG